MKLKKQYLIGVVIALLILILDFIYFWKQRFFYPLIIIALNIAWLQYWIDFFKEVERQKQIEQKFLEFVRNLVGTVKSGVSIPKSIINIADEDYAGLTPYVRKLKNQIEWGIPIHDALITFSKDTNNAVIKRSIAIVIEADKSGGDIENVLDSVSKSVVSVKKMKEERKSSTYPQIVQGYIVFFVFIGIMLLLQLKLFPQLVQMSESVAGGLGSLGVGGGLVGEGEKANLDRIFFFLILIQSFFAGLMIGKFSEGTLKQGLLHSLILMTLSTLIVTTAKGGI